MPADTLLSVRIDRANPRHTELSVWQNGGLAGRLCIETDFAAAVISRLTLDGFDEVLERVKYVLEGGTDL